MSDFSEMYPDHRLKDNVLDSDLYYELINLCSEIKLTQGITALNSTLIRHNSIKRFLIDYQKRVIVDLEREVNQSYGG